MNKTIALLLMAITVPQWTWAGQPGGRIDPAAGLFPPSRSAGMLFQEGTAGGKEEDPLLAEEKKWGFWDSYPRLWLVPISLVGFYVGVEQIKRQFALGNKADDAEEQGDTTEEQKLRDQATVHELWAVLSLVSATLMFSYGIKKVEPDIFDSMLIDRQGDRAYVGLQRAF